MSREGSSRIVGIILLIIILIPAGYAGLQFYSIDAVEKTITNPRIDIGISDILNIQDTLLDILLSRELDGEFDLQFEGKGVLPVKVKSIQAQVFLEDVYVGSFVSNDFFTIPAQGIETAHMEFKIDLTQIGLTEVEQICTSIIQHNGEMKISVEALMEPIIIAFPVTMALTETDYILSYSDAPEVNSLSWSTTSCEIGDQVIFSSTVSNVFRDATVIGNLDIIVREDVNLGSDISADIFSYPIELEPGETITVSDSFTTYKDDSTSGFFLKAQWGTSTISEQSSSYPPRLQVIEGTLDVEEVYWTVDGTRTTSCDLGETVQAHIRLGALNAALEDDIIVKVRKDRAILTDADITSKDYHVSLEKNQDTDIVISFCPTEASDSLIRGYFIEIEGDTQWTMTNEYPPRLTVKGAGSSQGSLTVTNSWWTRSGSIVTSANYRDMITGKVTVEAVNGPVSGDITVNIKRDLSLSFDDVHASQSFSVSIEEGEQKTYSVSFSASEVSDSSFRGYFIELDDDFSWSMSNSYPPRLTVNEIIQETASEGHPTLYNAWWTSGGPTVTEVSQGDTVKAVVRIKSVDGYSSGYVSVHIRKDLALLPDDDLLVNTYEINIDEDEYADIEITFTASDKSGFTFRGYFIEVDFTSWSDSWTMSSDYPPRLEVN